MDEQSLRDAYRALVESVRELEAANRLTYAASVKPRLKLLLPQFDEATLGFGSFKSFLLAATELGYITLKPTPGGDLEVHTVEAAPAPTGTRESPTRRRMREDVWKAFIDWTDAARFWDRQEHRAVIAVGDDAAGFAADPSRYVPVQAVSKDTHVSWMRDFVDALEDGDVKAALASALERPEGHRDFGTLIRQLGLASRWYPELFKRVTDHVTTWAAANGVQDDLFESKEHPGPALRPLPPAGPLRPFAPSVSVWSRGTRLTRPSATTEAIRARVMAAIQRMPLADLLRLAIPAEYLLTDV